MSTRLPQALPTSETPEAETTRRLARAIGPVIQPSDPTAIAADLEAIGLAVYEGQETSLAALDQAFVNSATDHLSELERLYGLPLSPSLSNEERQQRLLAKVRAARAGTPQDIKRAISVYDENVEVYETTAAEAYASGDMRHVFQFGVVVKVALIDDPRTRAEIIALVEQMKPAHTKGNIASGRGFFCDGFMGSRTDDTLLGS